MYLIAASDESKGLVVFVDKEKEQQEEHNKCVFETYHHANSLMSDVRARYEMMRGFNWKVRVIPLKSILSKVDEKRIKNIILSLEDKEIL